MRVLNWNIRQGGGTRIASICRHIAEVSPDLLVLSEYRAARESALRSAMADVGLPFVVTSEPPANRNGVLVASKWQVDSARLPPLEVDRERWLPLRIADLDLDVLAVHIPGAPDNQFEDGYGVSGAKRKELMWESLLAYANERRGQRAVIVGDFNTGLRIDAEGAMFKMSHYMQSLIGTGFIDTWRYLHPQTRDFTFYTKRKDKSTGQSADLNGFRLDYAFVSPLFKDAIAGAAILQEPRKAGASDHASLVLDLDVGIEAPRYVTAPPMVAAASLEPPRSRAESGRALARPPVDSQPTNSSDPKRHEILTLLRRADCHYGYALRDEEAGLSVDEAARDRNVRTDRIVALRAAVRRVADGEPSRNKAHAGHEDGVLRALLHFKSGMSAELIHHIDMRLAQLRAEFIPNLKAVPLQCRARGGGSYKNAVSRERACECGLTHAGECS